MLCLNSPTLFDRLKKFEEVEAQEALKRREIQNLQKMLENAQLRLKQADNAGLDEDGKKVVPEAKVKEEIRDQK